MQREKKMKFQLIHHIKRRYKYKVMAIDFYCVQESHLCTLGPLNLNLGARCCWTEPNSMFYLYPRS